MSNDFSLLWEHLLSGIPKESVCNVDVRPLFDRRRDPSQVEAARERTFSVTETVQFILALGLLIGFAKAMGYVAYRFNQPAVLGELLAGLILGPTILDLLGSNALFPQGHDVTHTLIEVAEIGV